MQKRIVGGGLVALALLASGCEGFLTNFAAGSSVRVFGRAAPAVQRFADPELAEAAIPSSIATLEGLMMVQPDNETLHLLLARTYGALAFGFFADHMEEAEVNDDQGRFEHYRARASAAFRRGRAIGLEQMTQWEPDDGGAEGAIRRGEQAWRRYLQQFDEQRQGGQLFWTAYNWAQYIGINRDDVSALADLPYVIAIAERARALDESFNDYAPHALVGGLVGAAPQQIGGRPDIAAREFDIAIQRTQRHNLMYLVLRARIVAVALQDRRMYRSLLEEVIAAGDVDPANRLQNQLAKRRARRYLAQIDNLFEPEAAAAAGNGAAPAQE